MTDTDNPQKQLNTALDYLENLSKQDLPNLQKKIYSSFSALAYLALEGKNAKFKDGWALDLLDREGHPIFTEDDAKTVESISLKFVKPLFQGLQKGGESQDNPTLKPFSTKGMIESSVPSINPDDVSLDKTFWKVKASLAPNDNAADASSASLATPCQKCR